MGECEPSREGLAHVRCRASKQSSPAAHWKGSRSTLANAEWEFGHVVQNPGNIDVKWSPRHIPCTDHSSFPVLATIFFGRSGGKSATQAFGLEGFERSAQNADDNDGGGFSRHGSWYDFDELSGAAGALW